MSGLLEKDICLLLRGHRNMLILFFMICVFLGLGQPGTFILGYLPTVPYLLISQNHHYPNFLKKQ